MLNFKGRFFLQKLDSAIKCISYTNTNILHCVNQNSCSKILCNERLSLGQSILRQRSTKAAKYSFIVDAHDVLKKSEVYSNTLSQPPTQKDLQFNEDELLQKQWISMSYPEMLENFELLSHYVSQTENALIDLKYHGILEVLRDQCPKFTDQELHYLLSCLELWHNYKIESNFQELWKVVDNECLKRMPNWSINELLLTHDQFYKVRLSRFSEFSWHSLKKLGRRVGKMTQENLVQFAFLLKVNRNIPIHFYEFEYQVEKCADKLTIEELAIVAMAFVHYEKSVKSIDFLMKFIDVLCANIDSVSDAHMSTFLQLLRFNMNKEVISKLNTLLKLLETQVAHRSLQAVSQIADMKRTVMLHNEQLILKIADRFEKEIKNACIKDIERIICLLYMFNYDPATTSFYSTAINELLEPSRGVEISKFPKSFFYIILNMTHINFYTEEGLKRVMDPEFINSFSRNNMYNVNGHYLHLDYFIEIDHPEYNGPRLNTDLRAFLIKRFGAPRKDRIIISEKAANIGRLTTEVEHTCKKVLGSESLVYRDAVLPFVTKTNVIICRDKETNTFLSPEEKLSNIPEGSIKYAPDDGKNWYVFVIATFNVLMKETLRPTGMLTKEIRQLYRIGYTPIVIPYNEWENISNDKQRQEYIKHMLNG